MSNVLCTICARGGSKGVKGKNVRELCGKPLMAHTIEQAIASNLFEHIVISTDSDLIAEAAVKYGAEVFFKRDAAMAHLDALLASLTPLLCPSFFVLKHSLYLHRILFRRQNSL